MCSFEGVPEDQVEAVDALPQLLPPEREIVEHGVLHHDLLVLRGAEILRVAHEEPVRELRPEGDPGRDLVVAPTTGSSWSASRPIALRASSPSAFTSGSEVKTAAPAVDARSPRLASCCASRRRSAAR